MIAGVKSGSSIERSSEPSLSAGIHTVNPHPAESLHASTHFALPGCEKGCVVLDQSRG